MNQEELNQFILKKWERQNYLQERKKNLEDLDLELSGAKFGRAFRTFYYYFKRFLSLILGFAFIIGALVLIFNPDVVFKDDELKNTLKEGYFKSFLSTAGESVQDATESLVFSSDLSQANTYVDLLTQSFDNYLEKEILFLVKLVGVLLLVIAFALLYVSRLSKQLRRRNSSISKADTLTQEIINDYKLTIEEEVKELEVLRRILQTGKA